MKYFIANWKANKNLSETRSWVDGFLKNINKNSQIKQKLQNNLIKVIICPSFPLIYPLKEMLAEQKNIVVGSQDISLVEGGTYTGEVSANNLSSLVEYTIIGHSERKKYLHETNDVVMKKFAMAKRFGIEPIYCIADSNVPFPHNVNFLCYEPPAAISKGDGKGNYESVTTILEIKLKISLPTETKFIYGGSVNEQNAKEYLQHDEIDGFLIGGASLDAERFNAILSQG